MQQKLLHFLNQAKEKFALLHVLKQLLIILILAFIIILLFSVVIGSIKDTYTIFVDPSSLVIAEHSLFSLSVAFVITVLGIVITGFIISILSSFLETTLHDIRFGRLPFKGMGHTLIINYNQKIEQFLEELNQLYKDINEHHEVVLMIADDDMIEDFQNSFGNSNFSNLSVSVRYGDPLQYKRYEELSIYAIHALIILQNDAIEESFERDNYNLQIVHTLCNQKKFLDYMKQKRASDKPVKALVEFHESKHLSASVSHLSSNEIVSVSSDEILNNILNLSILNIDFYKAWLELLSYDGYEFYFVSAKELHLTNVLFRDAVLGFEEIIPIGVSTKEDNRYLLKLNAHNYTFKEDDFVIVLAENLLSAKSTAFEPLKTKPLRQIAQPSEIFDKNIVIVGDEKEITIEAHLNMQKSSVTSFTSDYNEMFEKGYFDRWIHSTTDYIIINLSDAQLYRLAFYLQNFYSKEEMRKFVFMIHNPKIAKFLEESDFDNTIVSLRLSAKYIAQIANQLALNQVFVEMFRVEGSEINFIEIEDIPSASKTSLTQLKTDLAHSDITYMGIVKKDGTVHINAKDITQASKIVVLSDGEH